MPHSLRERDQAGGLHRAGLLRRIDHQQQLAAVLEVIADEVRFLRRKVDGRSGDHEHGGVFRDLAGLEQGQLADFEVLVEQRIRGGLDAVVRGGIVGSRSPWPCTKYTFFVLPSMSFFSAFVTACSSADVARSVRPSYSRMIVGHRRDLVLLRLRSGCTSASMYSTETCFDRYS